MFLSQGNKFMAGYIKKIEKRCEIIIQINNF